MTGDSQEPRRPTTETDGTDVPGGFRDRRSLAGEWRFALDPDDRGVDERWFAADLEGTIDLPGTTDEGEKGEYERTREPDHLTRPYPYEGAAWYQRTVTVPPEWADKRILLRLERSRIATVWIDGERVGTADSLSTPHAFDVTDALVPEDGGPAERTLTIRIDTDAEPITFPGVQRSHTATEHTQTNWNGIVGDLELVATDPVWIDEVQAYPDPENGTVAVETTVGNRTGERATGTIRASADCETADHDVPPDEIEFVADGRTTATLEYDLGDDPRLWDEFDPDRYALSVALEATVDAAVDGATERYRDATTETIGLRSIEVDGTQLSINGRTTFLRGNVDSCVFPETGYPPTGVDEWRDLFATVREYGINHYRFHSWCPPEAAFEAADELGIYLQPELPLWNNGGAFEDDDAAAYFRAEAGRILETYGNHPSFVLFSLGNELSGDADAMAALVEDCRERDPRRLYAAGAYNGLSNSTLPEADDVWITASVPPEPTDVESGREMVRAAAIDDAPPATTTDYREAIESIPIPVIAHEIGQYQVYPDYEGLEKYDGVLEPRNLELARDHLEAHGMLDRAAEFARASGELAVRCYREDVEAAFRTPGFGGFQLLDLQDFPGQGTALVGILDSFMDSKGLIEPAEWRRFCSATVPLVRLETRTWTTDERLTAAAQLAHYGPESVADAVPEWRLLADGDPVAEGRLPATDLPQGELIDLGSIEVDLDGIDAPARLRLELEVDAADGSAVAANDYDVWVYPPDDPAPGAPAESESADPDDLDDGPVVRRSFDEETRDLLADGADVLLVPDHGDLYHSARAAFAPCFWSYALFKRNAPPETMGPTLDPDHPMLEAFPTAAHGDWQWWHLLTNARPIVLDDAPDEFVPAVGMVDNIERNRKLGLVFETAVGDGNLLVCAVDLLECDDDPSVRAFYRSLLEYAGSEAFDPDREISEAVLRKVLAGR